MTNANYTYSVFVDDNFHYQDEEERYKLGTFGTLEEAVTACKSVVDGFLQEDFLPEKTAAERYERYKSFGPDPFILTDDPEAKTSAFSAWSFAKSRCESEE